MVFIPCLLDLEKIVGLCAYMIPGVDRFDSIEFEAITSSDHVIEFDDGFEERLGFEFFIVPSNSSSIDGEVWRLIVEGRYGLACRLCSGKGIETPEGIPTEAFIFIRPSSLLQDQQIAEDVVF